jgi:hypothetical protein
MATGYRQFIQPDATELSTQKSLTLGTGNTGFDNLFPKSSSNRNIVGVKLTISATVTTSGSSLASFTAGSLIKELKITKGANTLIDFGSEQNLEDIWHILTGLAIGQGFNSSGQIYFSNPATTARTSAGSATSVEVIYFPLYITTEDVTPIFSLTMLPYTTPAGGTSGTALFQIEFMYGDQAVQDDYFVITTAAAALSNATDIDVTTYFSNQNAIDELWMRSSAGADADLNYEIFQYGSNTQYDHTPYTTLIQFEEPMPYQTHVTAFFKLAVPAGTVYQAQGVSSTQVKLVLNFTNSTTPTFYARLSGTIASPAPVSPTPAASPYTAPVNQAQATAIIGTPQNRPRRRRFG